MLERRRVEVAEALAHEKAAVGATRDRLHQALQERDSVAERAAAAFARLQARAEAAEAESRAAKEALERERRAVRAEAERLARATQKVRGVPCRHRQSRPCCRAGAGAGSGAEVAMAWPGTPAGFKLCRGCALTGCGAGWRAM